MHACALCLCPTIVQHVTAYTLIQIGGLEGGAEGGHSVHIVRIEIAVEYGGIAVLAGAGAHPTFRKDGLQGLENGMQVVAGLADGEVLPLGIPAYFGFSVIAVFHVNYIGIQVVCQVVGGIFCKAAVLVAAGVENGGFVKALKAYDAKLFETARTGVLMVYRLLKSEGIAFFETVLRSRGIGFDMFYLGNPA